MNLLQAIYSSPIQLLEKAQEDGGTLVSALLSQDEPGIRSTLFNFVVTAYHVWDWIKAYRPDLDAAATNPVAQYESLGACRDLANASKHVVLDVTRGPYLKHPAMVQDVVVSAIASPPVGTTSSQAITPSTQVVSWRLKIQLASGRRLAAEDLVTEVLEAWKKYFKQHSIK